MAIHQQCAGISDYPCGVCNTPLELIEYRGDSGELGHMKFECASGHYTCSVKKDPNGKLIPDRRNEFVNGEVLQSQVISLKYEIARLKAILAHTGDCADPYWQSQKDQQL